MYTIGAQIADTIVQHEGISRRAAMRRALELLHRVRIPSPARRLKNYPHEMSGGMRQRAMIALALACSPSVLLADELTTALDVSVQIQILLLLRQLLQELGMAVVFVTHDVGAAAEISDRIAVMYGGRFVETATAREIMRAPRHPYTQGLLASTVHGGLRGKVLETIPGTPTNLARMPPGCVFAPRSRCVSDQCTRGEVPIGVLSDRRDGALRAPRRSTDNICQGGVSLVPARAHASDEPVRAALWRGVKDA
jgi:peptide/nickel transport system ATP-binding protein